MKTDLNKLSFSELQKEVSELENKVVKAIKKESDVWQIGENYFIRTVTMALLGKLVKVTGQEFVLENASWIADTGRFADFLGNNPTNTLEVEPFQDGEVIVGRGALIDACIWKFELMRTQK